MTPVQKLLVAAPDAKNAEHQADVPTVDSEDVQEGADLSVDNLTAEERAQLMRLLQKTKPKVADEEAPDTPVSEN